MHNLLFKKNTIAFLFLLIVFVSTFEIFSIKPESESLKIFLHSSKPIGCMQLFLNSEYNKEKTRCNIGSGYSEIEFKHLPFEINSLRIDFGDTKLNEIEVLDVSFYRKKWPSFLNAEIESKKITLIQLSAATNDLSIEKKQDKYVIKTSGTDPYLIINSKFLFKEFKSEHLIWSLLKSLILLIDLSLFFYFRDVVSYYYENFLNKNKKSTLKVLSVIGFTITIISAFPGYTNFDEIFMLNEGLNSHVSDLHPPMQMLIWVSFIKLIKFFGGNDLLQISSVLIVQNVVFWLSAYLVSTWFRSLKWGLLFLLAIFLSPIGLVYLGHVGKDSQMAIAFFTAIAMLGQATNTQSKKLLLLSIIPIFFGISIRSNGIIAAIPLVAIFSDQIKNKFTNIKLNRYLFQIIIFLTLISCNFLIKEIIIKEKCCDAAQALMTPVYDLMSVSKKINQNLVPERLYLNNTYNLQTIKNNFNETYINWDGLKIPSHTDFKDVIKAWLNCIFNYPGIFLKHRVRTLQLFLGLHQGPAPFPFMYGFYCNLEAIGAINHQIASYCQSIAKIDNNFLKVKKKFEHYISSSSDSLMYKIWPYAIASLIVILWRVKLMKESLFLTMKCNSKNYYWIWQSAVMHILPFLLLANSAQFRYLLWSALSFFIFIMLSIDEFVTKKFDNKRNV